MSKVVDLDALTNEAALPRVRLFGRELLVRPITGAAAHRLAVVQEQDATGTKMLAALLEVVRGAVPGLTADEVDRLSVEQLAALIQLTRGAVADVEAMLAAQAANAAQATQMAQVSGAGAGEGAEQAAEQAAEKVAGN